MDNNAIEFAIKQNKDLIQKRTTAPASPWAPCRQVYFPSLTTLFLSCVDFLNIGSWYFFSLCVNMDKKLLVKKLQTTKTDEDLGSSVILTAWPPASLHCMIGLLLYDWVQENCRRLDYYSSCVRLDLVIIVEMGPLKFNQLRSHFMTGIKDFLEKLLAITAAIQNQSQVLRPYHRGIGLKVTGYGC